ncbi:MAG: polyprenyl synthetase family protein [Candidatus Uhrbacteria bacterium]|nr:polyprenyl synthetase family protein [Candidatus Uhrbacteria bacterium]
MPNLRSNDQASFQAAFQPALETFVSEQLRHLSVQTIDAKKLARSVADMATRKGKRMRPYLAIRTAMSCGVSEAQALPLGIALELFHDFALIHDDIIDRSAQRRGRPTIHTIFENEHQKKSWKGSAEHYGISSAILAGDLLYTWAERAFDEVRAPDEIRSKLERAWSLMKEEVILGQTMDVITSVLPRGISRKQLLDVQALKSGRYSIGRPILLGYLFGGVDIAERTVLDATEPLGIAFQIQDDIIGTFGDAKQTGKSIDSDLKEGKITMLVWEAQRRIESEEDRAIWERALGNPDATEAELNILRRIIQDTGALVYVRALSEQLVQRSIERAYELPKISNWFIELAESLEGRKT